MEKSKKSNTKKASTKKKSSSKTSTTSKKVAAKKPVAKASTTSKKPVTKTKSASTKKEVIQNNHLKKDKIKKVLNRFLDSAKKYYNNNQKLCIEILMAIVVLIIALAIYTNYSRNYSSSINKNYDTNLSINGLQVTYKNGKDIELNKFNHSFTAEKEITILNATTEYITYNIEWKGVSNTLKEQYNFTYKLKGTGNNAGNTSTSQVPASDSKLLSKLIVSPHKTHTYKLIFTYDEGKKEETGSFKGYLNIYIDNN